MNPLGKIAQTKKTDEASDGEQQDESGNGQGGSEGERGEESAGGGEDYQEGNSEIPRETDGQEEISEEIEQLGERQISGEASRESEATEIDRIDGPITYQIPSLKRGDSIKATDSETGEEKEFEILGLAGKRGSKKWKDSYNIKETDSGRKYWINLREYDNIRRVIEEEEVLLGCESDKILEAKKNEFESWKRNNVYEEVRDEGQKTMSVRWVITNKEKEGKLTCKARLVARGFEESDFGMEKEALTCASEAFRLCLSLMLMRGWEARTMDVKTAYLQGENIRRDVFIKPPIEAKTHGLWKLNKTIYGLKDAARACMKV